jgi:peptidoglycan/LPS O-acetylase OafA/YrhL
MANADGGGKRPYFPCFDGLRAIAALTVVLVHVTFAVGANYRSTAGAYFVRMDIGVAIFFLISGFLLYRPFVAALFEGRTGPDLWKYCKRRFLRIFPAYWLALTVAVVTFHATPRPITSPWDYVTYYGLFQVYTDSHFTGGIIQAWSLNVELVFYLFLPVYAALTRLLTGSSGLRHALRVQVGGLAVLYGASVAFRFWQLRTSTLGPKAFDWFPAHLDFFALGMALAVASAHPSLTGAPARLLRAVGALPGACWAVSALCFWVVSTRLGLRRDLTYTTGQALARQFLYGMVALFLLLPAVFGPQDKGVVRKLLASPPLAGLGKVSYGIYLWHLFAMALWFDLSGVLLFSGGLNRALGATVIVTVLIATASYFVVERPAIALGHRQRWAPFAFAPSVPVHQARASATGAASADGRAAGRPAGAGTEEQAPSHRGRPVGSARSR